MTIALTSMSPPATGTLGVGRSVGVETGRLAMTYSWVGLTYVGVVGTAVGAGQEQLTSFGHAAFLQRFTPVDMIHDNPDSQLLSLSQDESQTPGAGVLAGVSVGVIGVSVVVGGTGVWVATVLPVGTTSSHGTTRAQSSAETIDSSLVVVLLLRQYPLYSHG